MGPGAQPVGKLWTSVDKHIRVTRSPMIPTPFPRFKGPASGSRPTAGPGAEGGAARPHEGRLHGRSAPGDARCATLRYSVTMDHAFAGSLSLSYGTAVSGGCCRDRLGGIRHRFGPPPLLRQTTPRWRLLGAHCVRSRQPSRAEARACESRCRPPIVRTCPMVSDGEPGDWPAADPYPAAGTERVDTDPRPHKQHKPGADGFDELAAHADCVEIALTYALVPRPAAPCRNESAWA